MSPGRVLRTSPGDRGQARTRRQIAQKYLEVAELAATEATEPSSTVVVGVAVLAGSAAADAICLAATDVRYAGTDHAEAAVLLEQTDRLLGAELARLNRLKPAAHYGSTFIGVNERDQALRASRKLVEAATMRTP